MNIPSNCQLDIDIITFPHRLTFFTILNNYTSGSIGKKIPHNTIENTNKLKINKQYLVYAEIECVWYIITFYRLSFYSLN